MPYAFHMESWHAVDLVWFYGMATDEPDLEDEEFEAALEGTGLSREDAIDCLIRPRLSKLGFPAEGWSVRTLTEDYICYEGCCVRHLWGREHIVFEPDSLFSWAENFPESKTMHFTRAHERLAKVMRIDELGETPMLRMERWEQEEEEEDEEGTEEE
jgi:hypothetical protein